MPEIAEVYTMAGGLSSLLAVELDSPLRQLVEPINHPLIKWPEASLTCVHNPGGNGLFKDKEEGLLTVLGARPYRVVHRGKALGLFFEDCRYALHFRFGMSGRLGLIDSKHARVVFEFDNGEFLYYIDPRKFGKVAVEKAYTSLIAGKDVLEADESFLAELCRSKRRIRSVLTDQRGIAGIGNYLAAEILWKARINPFKPAYLLTPPAIASLLKNARETIVASARAGGATLLDYFGLGGEPGTFSKSLNVYRKENCPRCGGPVSRVRNPGEQSSYFCPVCQPYEVD